MMLAWFAIAGLAIVVGVAAVALVGLAMTRSDRDLRGFVDSSAAFAMGSIESGGGQTSAGDEALR
jgi:asparagine N-glycosylation enzyme membrane subunit Stt3